MRDQYGLPGYDKWKTAYPPEWDNEESDDPLDDGDAAYDAMMDDRLTED